MNIKALCHVQETTARRGAHLNTCVRSSSSSRTLTQRGSRLLSSKPSVSRLVLIRVAMCSIAAPVAALPPPALEYLPPSQWMVDAIAEREHKAERSLMHRFDICRVRQRGLKVHPLALAGR